MQNRFVIFDLPFGGRDEFEPIEGMPEFRTAYVRPQDYRGGAQVLILPGSGRTIADLDYLRANGGESIIRSHLSAGGVVVGICGGYQILGERLVDPGRKQGDRLEAAGLGLLPITTYFGPSMLEAKTTARLLVGKWAGSLVSGQEHRSGYSVRHRRRSARHTALTKVVRRELLAARPAPAEILPGFTWRPGLERLDGLVSPDRRIWGTYLHLIFYNDSFLHSFFECLR